MSASDAGVADVVPAKLFSSRPAREAIRVAARIANPVVSRIAGSRWFPAFGVLKHWGRRSGRAYVTPVGMGWTGSMFVIPLTFGDRSHWYLNVVARGGASVVWRGRERQASQPDVIAAAAARQAFPRSLWLLLRLVGVRLYLTLTPD